MNVRCTIHLIAFTYTVSLSLSLSVSWQLSWGHVLMELPITSITSLLETVKGEPCVHVCFCVFTHMSSSLRMVVWFRFGRKIRFRKCRLKSDVYWCCLFNSIVFVFDQKSGCITNVSCFHQHCVELHVYECVHAPGEKEFTLFMCKVCVFLPKYCMCATTFFLWLMENCCQDRDGSGFHWVPEVLRFSH